MEIVITRGYDYRLKVPNNKCFLVMKASGLKFKIDTIEQQNNEYFLFAPNTQTINYTAGTYKYQILGDNGVIAYGDLKVLENFDLVDQTVQIKSQNEIILEAIQAQIAGVATQSQQSISVGDKSISYMSLSELLKARDYFYKKVQRELNGYDVNSDGGKIRYKWSIR